MSILTNASSSCRLGALVTLTVAVLPAASKGADLGITWNWSFAGEAGTFVTGGNLVLDPVSPVSYNVIDFSVTQSSTGGTIGSASSGDYFIGSFASRHPHFTWDGTRVVTWSNNDLNVFLWNTYEDLNALVREHYFFGWALDPSGAQIEDPSAAAHWRDGGVVLAAGPVTVTPVVIPEPTSLTIGGVAVLVCCLVRFRWCILTRKNPCDLKLPSDIPASSM